MNKPSFCKICVGIQIDINRSSMNNQLVVPDKTEQVLIKLKSLSNDFIGQGSKKPSAKALRKVKKVLTTLESGYMPFPSITPMPTGGIILSWTSMTRDIVMIVDNVGDVQFTTSLKKVDIETAEVVDRLDSEGFVTDMLSIDHIMVWFCADVANHA